VTVTESKFLRNRITGSDREVDIVLKGELDGEPLLISIEVIEHRRPADVTWVESMLKKHENLPTNRLLLVSESGFTRQASLMVESQSGRVRALTPKIEAKAGGEEVGVSRILADNIAIKASGCVARLFRLPEAEHLRVDLEADVDIYDIDEKPLGPLGFLVLDIVNLPNVKNFFLQMAREHPEREDLKGFKTLCPIPQLRLFVKNNDLNRFEFIEALEIRGLVTYTQLEIPLTQARLGDRRYQFGESLFTGGPTVWVLTIDDETKTGKISWRPTGKLPSQEPAHVYHFPQVEEMGNVPIEPLPEEE
jgi:hypothetical protein